MKESLHLHRKALQGSFYGKFTSPLNPHLATLLSFPRSLRRLHNQSGLYNSVVSSLRLCDWSDTKLEPITASGNLHKHHFELFSYVLIGHCDCFGFDGMKRNHTELVMSLYRRVTFSHTQHAKIGFLFS